jgi:hypothetical protein
VVAASGPQSNVLATEDAVATDTQIFKMPKDLNSKQFTEFLLNPNHQIVGKKFLWTTQFTAPRNKRYTAYHVFCSVKFLLT